MLKKSAIALSIVSALSAQTMAMNTPDPSSNYQQIENNKLLINSNAISTQRLQSSVGQVKNDIQMMKDAAVNSDIMIRSQFKKNQQEYQGLFADAVSASTRSHRDMVSRDAEIKADIDDYQKQVKKKFEQVEDNLINVSASVRKNTESVKTEIVDLGTNLGNKISVLQESYDKCAEEFKQDVEEVKSRTTREIGEVQKSINLLNFTSVKDKNRVDKLEKTINTYKEVADVNQANYKAINKVISNIDTDYENRKDMNLMAEQLNDRLTENKVGLDAVDRQVDKVSAQAKSNASRLDHHEQLGREFGQKFQKYAMETAQRVEGNRNNIHQLAMSNKERDEKIRANGELGQQNKANIEANSEKLQVLGANYRERDQVIRANGELAKKNEERAEGIERWSKTAARRINELDNEHAVNKANITMAIETMGAMGVEAEKRDDQINKNTQDIAYNRELIETSGKVAMANHDGIVNNSKVIAKNKVLVDKVSRDVGEMTNVMNKTAEVSYKNKENVELIAKGLDVHKLTIEANQEMINVANSNIAGNADMILGVANQSQDNVQKLQEQTEVLERVDAQINEQGEHQAVLDARVTETQSQLEETTTLAKENEADIKNVASVATANVDDIEQNKTHIAENTAAIHSLTPEGFAHDVDQIHKHGKTLAHQTGVLQNHENRIHKNEAVIKGLQNQFSDFKNEVKEFKQETYGAIAGVAAIATLTQPYGVGNANVTVGMGHYHGANALALGMGYRPNANVTLRAGASIADDNYKPVIAASIGYEW